MNGSFGFRFIMVSFLALVMFIPLGLVSEVIQERSRHSDTTVRDISKEWGGAQLINGPVLVVPVTEEVTYKRKREATDPVTGRTLRDADKMIVYEHFEEIVTETRAPIYLYPDLFDMTADMSSQRRKRGIFEVPVYGADLVVNFDFDTALVDTFLGEKETADWAAAELRISLNTNRSLRGETSLMAGDTSFALGPISAPRDGESGILAKTGDPRDYERFTLNLSLNGAQNFGAAAVGRTSRLNIKSDWPDPSFFGSFLPDTSTISEDGFEAAWTVPHLARSLPQVSRESHSAKARNVAEMQVKFLTVNDFYQKSWRAARYGILFIGLTFLTILLLERTAERPAHPVQYLLIGLAQSIFILLMLAFAEQIGFGWAYLLAAGATIGLISVFGATALKLGHKSWVLTGVLVLVYLVLFLILHSADFALLAGALLAFVALALTMWLTRNEEWHSPGGGLGWSFPRLKNRPQTAD